MSPRILCIAGRIASGKSTVTSAVSGALHWRAFHFGSYVRALAEEMGLGEAQRDLQDLGQRLVSRDPLEFTRGFLAKSAWKKGESVVIDGLRHNEVLQSLQGLTSPAEVLLIYLVADYQTRLTRFLARGRGSRAQFDEVEEHPVERQATVLEDRADLILDGRLPIPELVSQVSSFVHQKEGMPPDNRRV